MIPMGFPLSQHSSCHLLLRRLTSPPLLYNLLILQLTLLLQLVNSYDVFMDGVYNLEYLPGGARDPIGTPNLPFSIDTDRQADGITSDSNFDVSSPHFPEYRGGNLTLADVSDRYLRYLNYKQSAEEQGVALYGDGDAVREAARLKITSMPGYESLPAPSKEFTVYAAIKWNPSDFAIQEGEYYSVNVTGSRGGYSDQYWYDGGIQVTAEGYSSYFDATSACYVGMGRCRSHLKKTRRVADANWMSLACAIGQFVRPLVQIEPGKESSYRWLPLDESELQATIFNVGLSTTFRAVYTGQLICFANDAHTLYWNNQGAINVTVTRVTWPPSPTSYYKELELPACDSAQVVYARLQNFANVTIPCNPNGGGSGWNLAAIEQAIEAMKFPTQQPSMPPSAAPSVSFTPTDMPTDMPTMSPTVSSPPSTSPSFAPSVSPTIEPTDTPTVAPV